MSYTKKNIKLYILTYNNETYLNTGLDSLFSSDLSKHNFSVYVINNHPNFNLHTEFTSRVSVLHNNLKPDFGIAYCSREWNFAIIDGFGDLNNPACDIVMHAQDDTLYSTDWVDKMLTGHYVYNMDLLVVGSGDQLTSHTPTSVKRVGLWDERFSMHACVEADYMLRGILYLKERVSICDTGHNNDYLTNPLPYYTEIVGRPRITDREAPSFRREIEARRRSRYCALTEMIFLDKWGFSYDSCRPLNRFLNSSAESPSPNKTYSFYPYFEDAIETLREQNYVFPNMNPKEYYA